MQNNIQSNKNRRFRICFSGNGGFVSVGNCKQLPVLILDSLNPHGNVKALD